jgi:polyhydroxybutyrate depolymerase
VAVTSQIRGLGVALAMLGLGLLAMTACRPSGRAPDPRLPEGSSAQKLTVGTTPRTFRLYVPAGLGAAPVPMVVMLHGGFGSGSQAESSYGWNQRADADRFVVAYPDGLDRAWAVGDGCCGSPGRDGVDDVSFIRQMVAWVGQHRAIDARRVFATGISNGGMLAYRPACDTTLFAAIGPDSATLLGPCPSPEPISVIHIHGRADTRVRYEGGEGDGVGHINGPAVESVVEQWRRVSSCDTPSVQVDGDVSTSVATCPNGRSVELITIDGAGHQWPGAPGRPLIERALGLDPPSSALDATQTIWTFFASHPAAT